MLLQGIHYWTAACLHQRRTATRYEKTARSFASFLNLDGRRTLSNKVNFVTSARRGMVDVHPVLRR